MAKPKVLTGIAAYAIITVFAQADAAGLAITADPQIICHAGYAASNRPP